VAGDDERDRQNGDFLAAGVAPAEPGSVVERANQQCGLSLMAELPLRTEIGVTNQLEVLT